MDSRGVLMLGLVVACMLAVSLIPRGEAEAVRDAEGCPYSGAVPTPENVERVREAILCLLNRERTRAGLPALVRNRELELASQLHSEDMGARDFYEHDTPDGIEPAVRAEASGYPVVGATVGENIHWGIESEATPVRIVKDWMESPGHRVNILRRAFTEVGVGVAHDAPEPDIRGRAGVYTTVFGGRTYP